MKEIKATGNCSKRTYTIRAWNDGVLYAKYRTNRMTSDEFDANYHNTQGDWHNYLRHNDVIIIK